MEVYNRDGNVICQNCEDSHAAVFFMDRVMGYGGFQLKGSCWSRDNYSTVLGDDPRYSKDKGFIVDE